MHGREGLWLSISKQGTSQVVLMVKNPPAKAGDMRDAGFIPELGRSPGGGYGNPLQYPYLENPMDRGLGRPQSMGSHRGGQN